MKFNTLRELIKLIPDQKTAHQYLAQQRWADGVIRCPHCDNEEAYVYKNGIQYKCKSCRKQFMATTDTIMENTKIPLVDWILAMHLMTHKKGISSVQMGKDLGITQKSAWHMMRKIRTAMGCEEEIPLSGTVEMDEAFVGGASRFKHRKQRMYVRKNRYRANKGRNWVGKTPVFGLIQRNEDGKPSRVIAKVMGNVEMLTITKMVRQNVQAGTKLMGDGFMGYQVLKHGYKLQCVDHSKGWYVDGDCHTNTIEGFWSLMKKGFKSTYHQISKKHLQMYVDEATFKYNYRTLDTQSQIECLIKNMYRLSQPSKMVETKYL